MGPDSCARCWKTSRCFDCPRHANCEFARAHDGNCNSKFRKMTAEPLLVVVLAAGKGVRMRSSIPKVLHAVAGRSMLAHVLATARAAGAGKLALVVAPGMEAVC